MAESGEIDAVAREVVDRVELGLDPTEPLGKMESLMIQHPRITESEWFYFKLTVPKPRELETHTRGVRE